MEDFKFRILLEYKQLKNRLEKLSAFLKEDKVKTLSTKAMENLMDQEFLMQAYLKVLEKRMKELDINVDYEFISFKEVMDMLDNGLPCSRKSWGSDIFITKQIPSVISSSVIPKMISLEESVKAIIMVEGEEVELSYRDQVLIISKKENKFEATYFIPTWEDIYATDWYVVK